MSVEHMAMVFNAEGLDGSEKLLLLALTNYTDAYGYCWPGEERLAADTGTSVSTVRRAKRQLKQKNLVKSVRRTDRRTGQPITNLTRVNLPLLTSMARPKRAFNDNLMAQISFGEDDVEDAPGGEKTPPDLLTDQFDPYQGADCAEVGIRLTRRAGQSDSQSTREPVVDPPEVPAPSARSAADARRATTGSSARASGFAASGNNQPRLTKEQKQAVQAVRDLLPADFNRALPVRTPRNIADGVLGALAAGMPRERTPQQLVEFRVMARWDGYWAAKFYAGELEKAPFGALLAMVRDQAECGSLSCEDRVDIFTGAVCAPCAERRADHRAERDAGEGAGATPNLPQPRQNGGRPKCPGCGIPLARAKAAVLCLTCVNEGA